MIYWRLLSSLLPTYPHPPPVLLHPPLQLQANPAPPHIVNLHFEQARSGDFGADAAGEAGC
jgi:hypothetical protein